MAKKSKSASRKHKQPQKPAARPAPAPVKAAPAKPAPAAAAPAPSRKPAPAPVPAAKKAAAPAAAPAAADPGIRHIASYVKELRLDSPRAIAHLTARGPAPQLVVRVNVQARKLRDAVFEVEVHFAAKARRGAQDVYEMNIVQAGAFALGAAASKDVDQAVMVDCPKLLMPALAELVAATTQRSGFGAVRIGDIDFAALRRGATRG